MPNSIPFPIFFSSWNLSAEKCPKPTPPPLFSIFVQSLCNLRSRYPDRLNKENLSILCHSILTVVVTLFLPRYNITSVVKFLATNQMHMKTNNVTSNSQTTLKWSFCAFIVFSVQLCCVMTCMCFSPLWAVLIPPERTLNEHWTNMELRGGGVQV